MPSLRCTPGFRVSGSSLAATTTWPHPTSSSMSPAWRPWSRRRSLRPTWRRTSATYRLTLCRTRSPARTAASRRRPRPTKPRLRGSTTPRLRGSFPTAARLRGSRPTTNPRGGAASAARTSTWAATSARRTGTGATPRPRAPWPAASAASRSSR